MKLPIVRQTDKNFHIVDFQEIFSVGFRKLFLLMSDIHFDSIKCDKELLKKHLKQAQDSDALVMIFGDLFDVMQGRNDRRSDKLSLDPKILELMQETGGEYYDVAVQMAIDFFKPFKNNMFFASYGNHETSINRHNEFDVMRKFTSELEMNLGQYEGYIKFNMEKANKAISKLLKYHHGYGGAKRSKGMLDSQLYAYVYSDADICVRGHNHYKFLDTNGREKVTERGKIKQTKQYHVNLGTYKRKNNGMGWEVEKGFFPSVLGGWWMELKGENTQNNGQHLKIKLYEAD